MKGITGVERVETLLPLRSMTNSLKELHEDFGCTYKVKPRFGAISYNEADSVVKRGYTSPKRQQSHCSGHKPLL